MMVRINVLNWLLAKNGNGNKYVTQYESFFANLILDSSEIPHSSLIMNMNPVSCPLLLKLKELPFSC